MFVLNKKLQITDAMVMIGFVRSKVLKHVIAERFCEGNREKSVQNLRLTERQTKIQHKQRKTIARMRAQRDWWRDGWRCRSTNSPSAERKADSQSNRLGSHSQCRCSRDRSGDRNGKYIGSMQSSGMCAKDADYSIPYKQRLQVAVATPRRLISYFPRFLYS